MKKYLGLGISLTLAVVLSACGIHHDPVLGSSHEMIIDDQTTTDVDNGKDNNTNTGTSDGKDQNNGGDPQKPNVGKDDNQGQKDDNTKDKPEKLTGSATYVAPVSNIEIEARGLSGFKVTKKGNFTLTANFDQPAVTGGMIDEIKVNKSGFDAVAAFVVNDGQLVEQSDKSFKFSGDLSSTISAMGKAVEVPGEYSGTITSDGKNLEGGQFNASKDHKGKKYSISGTFAGSKE